MNYIHNIKLSACLALVCAVLFSCTDLEIDETDSLLTEDFQGLSGDESASTLNDAYNSLIGAVGTQENLYSLSEVTSDALLIPTRGSDWGDNGLWRQLHQHSWTADHQFVTNTWNQWNQLQLTASEIIDPRSTANPQVKAQAHFLRALSMFIILDHYGQVPYRNTESLPTEDPEVLTREEAVDFIVSDLDIAIADMADSPAGSDNNRASKTAARYLKAKLMLNKHVFTKTAVNNQDMSEVVSLVDQISASGYNLVDGYFDIFKSDPDSETIWYIPTEVGPRIFNTLHYNSTQLGGGGWNGFSTLAEYYDLFEGDPEQNRLDANGDPIDGQEERRGGVPPMGIPIADANDPLLNGDDNEDGFVDGSNVGNGFLIGQQYAPDGTPLEDRAGSPLSFTKNFFNSATGQPSLVDNSEVTGIRLIKYNPRFGGFKNHHIFFRYSDAYLMKAEALLRSGESGQALSMVNDLRLLRKALPLPGLTEQDLLDERGRELFTEFWRRNDLIRFGQYTRDWPFKDPNAVNNPDRELFPIPATQVILNPNLVQNPGY